MCNEDCFLVADIATSEYQLKTRIHWLDRWIVRKQLDIMPTNHYVENQGKIIMESRENGQKLQFRQCFDDFEVKLLQIANLSKKLVLFKLKVIFSTNFRPKTKKMVRAVFEKNISVWFWGNSEPFLRISPNTEFFSKIRLWLFCLYSPLTSCKKSEYCLEPFLRRLRYQPINQPTNYYQQHQSYKTLLTLVQKITIFK